MKNLILSLILASVVVAVQAAEAYVPESRTVSEVFSTVVKKVYSVSEGGFEYTAYVVTWREHEVVVLGMALPSGQKRFEVGETVHCQMQQYDSDLRGQKTKRMSFILLNTGAAAVNTPDEIMQEVRKRRELRQRKQLDAPVSTTESAEGK